MSSKNRKPHVLASTERPILSAKKRSRIILIVNKEISEELQKYKYSLRDIFVINSEITLEKFLEELQFFSKQETNSLKIVLPTISYGNNESEFADAQKLINLKCEFRRPVIQITIMDNEKDESFESLTAKRLFDYINGIK